MTTTTNDGLPITGKLYLVDLAGITVCHSICLLSCLRRASAQLRKQQYAIVEYAVLMLIISLAGSEKMSKSGVTGQAMKETQHINKSLSALGDVMEGLDKKAKHIPFRNSKLTYLLQVSFVQ